MSGDCIHTVYNRTTKNYRDYKLHLIHRERLLDPQRTEDMEEAEHKLWDELYNLHLNLAENRDSPMSANASYRSQLLKRSQEIEMSAARCIGDTATPISRRVLQLHSNRRLLGIIYQEQELLSMDEAQSRAIGEDGAFIALGRR
jgi:hypothetical protein